MSWFKKKLPKSETEAQHDNRVEVVVNQQATKEVVESAKKANEVLKTLLNENGVTIQITLAAGAKKRVSHGH